jgi:hypothetical protein
LPSLRPRYFLFAFLFSLVLPACSFVADDGTLSIRLTFPGDNAVSAPASGAAEGQVQPRCAKSRQPHPHPRARAACSPPSGLVRPVGGRGRSRESAGDQITVEVDEYDNTAGTLLTNAPLLGRGWAQGITLSPGEFGRCPSMYDKGRSSASQRRPTIRRENFWRHRRRRPGGRRAAGPACGQGRPQRRGLVSSSQFNRIRKIDRYGYISHYAGNGLQDLTDGQPAATAPIGPFTIWTSGLRDLFLIGTSRS